MFFLSLSTLSNFATLPKIPSTYCNLPQSKKYLVNGVFFPPVKILKLVTYFKKHLLSLKLQGSKRTTKEEEGKKQETSSCEPVLPLQGCNAGVCFSENCRHCPSLNPLHPSFTRSISTSPSFSPFSFSPSLPVSQRAPPQNPTHSLG